MQGTETTLDQLELNREATITAFSDAEIEEKLMEMSCLPGNKIKIVRIAPLGDPLVVEINNNQLSLRKAEAKTITIKQ